MTRLRSLMRFLLCWFGHHSYVDIGVRHCLFCGRIDPKEFGQ